MVDNLQNNEHIGTCTSTISANMPSSSSEEKKKSFYSKLKESIPKTTDLFSADGNKEIGVLAIMAWHHGIAKLAARHKIVFPPVLLSTISTLISLIAVRAVKGKETTDQIVKFFDPSVDFLGTWMSLWLVPSLVLLPNALRTIKRADRTMWFKLVITHFALWYCSTAGTAKLYEMIKGKSSSICNSEAAPPLPVLAEAINTEPEVLIADMTDAAGAAEGSSEEGLTSGDDDVTSTPETVKTCVERITIEESIPVVAPAPVEVDAKAEKFQKQLKLLKFWGAITAFFYAAPFTGIISSKVPSLGGTTITALIAGQMMPCKVKKFLHPLLFATAISAFATVISDKLLNPGRNAFEESFLRRGKSWIDSLMCYTTPSASAIADGSAIFKTGDYFAQVLGPACAALAFRIFSHSEKLHSELPAIIAASAVSAVTSVFMSPLVGSIVGIPSELNAALAHRSISSALAVPSAKLTNASCELTVAAVLLTGLYGASGQWALDRNNITNEISAGVAVGAAAHSIGTASLLPSRPQAAAVASVALVSTGIVHAAVCALPGVPQLINKLGSLRS